LKIFDYSCKECQYIYEVFVRTDTDKPKCPKCDKDTDQERLLSFRGYAAATDDDSPRTPEDMNNYFGNGQYTPGYKKSAWKRKN
jgi:putative FmdB family regulatory protein